MRTRRGAAVLLMGAVLAAAGPAAACFGTRLRVGVPPGRLWALAAYATGYYVEEKAGVEPEFVRVEDPAAALGEVRVDLVLVPAGTPTPSGAVARPAGEVPGLGGIQYWVREAVLEDLRYFLVDRALGRVGELFGSNAYARAAAGGGDPQKAARNAVLDAL